MKRIMNSILIGLLGVLVITSSYASAYNIFHKITIEQDINKIYTKPSVIEVEKTIQNIEHTKQEEIIEEQPTKEISYNISNEEPSGNRIIIGNILNSPLMTDTTGENFYLNHNIYGNYDGIGVPYTDFRTDFTTRKTIIYAHSTTMGNGPFQALQNYHNNPSFYENNKYITINYNGTTYIYEIFSVYVSVAEDEYSEGLEYFYNINYRDDKWAETIEKYKSNSEYDTGVSVSSTDKILILQTCSMDPNYYEKYYRYNLLVMAKLVENY